MQPSEVEELLGRLARGESSAAGDLYVAYAAYLRAVVRRQLSDQLRAGFDSADVVQSVWVQVVRSLGTERWLVGNEAQLRALLAVIARRRLVSRTRSHARTVLDTPLRNDALDALPARRQPRASEVAQGKELWDRMLALCPPEHRAVLQLRREGLPLAEVAERTGFHEGSVRRILRRLSRQLATQTEPHPMAPKPRDGDEE